MKACPVCGRLYPDDAGFCPEDGTQLLRATEVPVHSDSQDRRIGQLMCGRYQIRRVVADGGMGRVYEAIDMQERRHVALKILHPDVALDAVALERFKREFEVSRQLPHHHIVDVLDFQPTHDGSYALVMEFLYGEELRAMLRREHVMAPDRLVRVVSQVAIALDEAHNRELVHRDLKPENIFLCQTSDGDIVKILDFGSVKDKTWNAKKLTVMGTTIGSPFYMAPEQAQGLDTLDHRADVWALAAIIYECVTGQVPFMGSNGPSILLEILTKEPAPPSTVGRASAYGIPPTLDRVLAQAFRKHAAQRIATVGALADAVGAAYGLEGSHREWGHASQAVLADRIRRTLPGLMVAAPPRAAADEFFGVAGSLDVVEDPFGTPVASIGAPAAQGWPKEAPSGPSVVEEPLVVPTRPFPIGPMLAVLVGMGALGLGILVAWLVLRA
ncbi:MAG: protein kinase [Polyangiaceae bacterium]|nr:protein kinase [Polyangiaceae bacterium]